MKNLLKVAFLTSITTAALVYVLLEWRPLGAIQHSPLVSWASSSLSSTASPLAEPKNGTQEFSGDEVNKLDVYQKTSSGVVNITSTSIAYTFFYRIPQS